MELETEDGATRIHISPGSQTTEVGRGTGIATSDRTVSRRHVSFHLVTRSCPVGSEGDPPVEPVAGRISFEVIGRNPVLVVSRAGEKQIFRRSERGELVSGDRISLSLKSPCFLSVKNGAGDGAVDKGVLDAVQRRERMTLQRRKEKEKGQGKETGRADVSRVDVEGEGGDAGQESKLQTPDLSEIDPVKEFGFLVRGHEFDQYTRKIRDIKHWNWFLNEQGDSNDEDERPDEATNARRKRKRKAKRGKGDDEGDDDWTGESEDEAAVEAATARRPKYRTRSKDQKRQKPRKPPSEEADQRKGYSGGDRRSEVEDEEDETLGGFIVENGEEEEQLQEMEEEEEEFEDEDED